MAVNQLHAGRDDVERFLEGTMSPGEESLLTRHLDTCPTCRLELEAAAGGLPWLREARRFLNEEPSAERGAGPASGQRVNRVADAGHASGTNPSDLAASEGGVSLDFLGPTDDPEMLGRLGPYEIAGLVGRGGTGIVFKAWQRSLNRFVALKTLAPHLATSAAARKRFAREAQAAAAVVHDHIVPIYAVDEYQGLPYMVMRYVPGRSLQERLDTQGTLNICEALRIGMQTAAGLAAAHAQGLVHRDIKPANILLEQGVERVLLTDFGLARAVDDASLTCSGVVAGTPQYMAPEQARGEAIDHRTDLFGLGSVLYAMFAGHSPFRAETTMGVLHRICTDQPRPLRQINPEVPDWMEQIIHKLHAKSPAHRFQSAAQVADLLGMHLANVQRTGRSLGDPWWKRWAATLREVPARRKVAAVAAIAGLAAWIWLGTSPARQLAERSPEGDSAQSPPLAERSPTSSAISSGSRSEDRPVSSAVLRWEERPEEISDVQQIVEQAEWRAFAPTPPVPDEWASEARRLQRMLERLERELTFAGLPEQ